jgi:hypothetical protein
MFQLAVLHYCRHQDLFLRLLLLNSLFRAHQYEFDNQRYSWHEHLFNVYSRCLLHLMFILFLFLSAFCYTARGDGNGCNAKEGNPFGPFWDTFGVDFVASEFYGPLHYDIYHHDMSVKWNEKYPSHKWPGMYDMLSTKISVLHKLKCHLTSCLCTCSQLTMSYSNPFSHLQWFTVHCTEWETCLTVSMSSSG